MIKKTKSLAAFKKAKTFFPGGVNSPVRAFGSVDGDPLFIAKGKGSKIQDIDGNKFIDYCCSWGPLILGHAPSAVVKAVNKACANGLSFGAPTVQENELAELIIKNNKYIEKIRFVSSGTEAVMSAIRLARGYTGKDKIIKFEGCYHGHADHLLVKAGSGLATFGTSSSAGVPEAFANETIVLPLNDIKAIEKAFSTFYNQIACIIIEPIPANNGLLLQGKEYLQYLREITQKHKALLIFDEVISGFRVGFEGAAGLYKIQPDIITYGKIIGGGMPVGAYGSSAAIMSKIAPEGNVYQAGTLSGNPVAMSAGKAQLSQCLKKGFYKSLEQKTKKLCDGVNQFAAKEKLPFKMISVGSIFWLRFSKDDIKTADDIDPKSMNSFRKLYAYLLDNGVYMGPSGYEVGFVSAAHSAEDIKKTIKVLKEGLKKALK